jgi:hypothetical protein
MLYQLHDRSEGGSVYKNSGIELLINRRVFEDDKLGTEAHYMKMI